MLELVITKINPDTAHPTLVEFLSNRPFVPLFFFSPYSLNTWLNNDVKSLYILGLGDEKVLVVYREKEDDLRILFDTPSQKMIDAIQNHFHPKFFSVNESATHPEVKSFYSDTEYQIQIEPVATLKDKRVRKKYNQAIRKNFGLRYESYKPEHVEKLKIFLKKWNTTRSELQNKFSKSENDVHFLELYKDDPKLIGGVVFNEDDIVAYRIGVETIDGNILALFNKVLRGYTELGIFLYVEGMRQLHDLGYKSSYIGPVNNDFKKQFLKDAGATEVYSYIIHNEFQLRDEGKYLMRIF